VWTPKRVGLLGIGTATFVAGYLVYIFFLGGIDGLAPLPAEFLRAAIDTEFPPPDLRYSEIHTKLRLAFGKECPQVKQELQFELRKKGWVIAAKDADYGKPELEGKVKMPDFNVAIFKKKERPGPDGFAWEIDTISSDVAFFQFDQPINSPMDMNKARLVSAELRGHILIINNHGTEAKSDDLEIIIEDEPLFYEDEKGRIWSEGLVKLEDKSTKPVPSKIYGQGLDMLLVRETAPGKKGGPAAKAKTEASGVDLITLKRNVQMWLYTAADSGPLAGPPKAAPAKAPSGPLSTKLVNDEKKAGPGVPAEYSCIYIEAPGPFVYDVPKLVATFDSPATTTNAVKVDRQLMRTPPDTKAEQKHDQLYCDHLELTFRKKEEVSGAAKGVGGDSGREIESAHATVRKGGAVQVAMDTENLEAGCDDLTFESASADRGARTTLRGEGTWAIKDGHKIISREIMLRQANTQGKGQILTAKGPGRVDLFDRVQRKVTTRAFWKTNLEATKYPDGDRDLDLLTLTEDASFIDEEHDQKLYGQIIKVLLDSSENTTKATPADSPSGEAAAGPRQKPRWVVAKNNVRAETSEMRIHDCTNLKIMFKDVPPTGDKLPDAAAVLPGPATAATKPANDTVQPGWAPAPAPPAPGAAPQAATAAATAGPPIGGGIQPAPATAPKSSSPTAKQPDDQKPKRPIDLYARDVTADMLRAGEKSELQELVAVGNVHVHQEGEKPEDKGVDIKGDELNLWHFVEGDILKVFGTPAQWAQLQLGELFLTGPKVITINQKDNTACVDGIGGMRMPSNTNFSLGGPSPAAAPTAAANVPVSAPAQPAKQTYLHIHWTTLMTFDGRDASYYGGVVATQDDSSLQCATMQAALDRKVSFKQGEKKGDQAKVEKIVAHTNVVVEDNGKDESGKLVRLTRLVCAEMVFDNIDQTVRAAGPGMLISWQYENPGESLSAPAKMPNKSQTVVPVAPVLMLTRVDFQDRLLSTQPSPESKTRVSTFHGNVSVGHVPTDNLDNANVQPESLPRGGMHVKSESLVVTEQQLPDKRSARYMEARNRVEIKSVESKGILMTARAQRATFNSVSDVVVLEGSPNNLAMVARYTKGPGSMPLTKTAERIQYNRKEGTIDASGVTGISGSGRLEDDRPRNGECIVAAANPPTGPPKKHALLI
jgi:lipopolysaccharide export system protein LptA